MLAKYSDTNLKKIAISLKNYYYNHAKYNITITSYHL